MAAAIEAQSLSSLTQLFANPPQYPRNPTHAAHPPLTLYIVRVPGSEGCIRFLSGDAFTNETADIFLTPLKPPSKTSIGPEAVQSCLYYLHVEQPEDETLRKTLEEGKKAEEQRKSTEANIITRKALPSTPYANYPLSERPPTPPKSYPYFQPPILGDQPDTQAARHAARCSHIYICADRRVSVRRKPVGPRPLDAEPEPDTARSIPRKPVSSAAKENEPPGPSRVGGDSPSDDPSVSFPKEHVYLTRSQGEPLLHTTLIRRDPASGSQWNIGHIAMSTDSLTQQETSVPICIEISTPGYQRFWKKQSASPESSESHKLEAEDLNRPRQSSLESSKQCSSPSHGYHCFSSHLMWMSSDFLAPFARMGRSNLHGSHGRWRAGLAEAVSKPRAQFRFTSPWKGDCVFSTAVDGRSWRCRHTLQSNVRGEEDPGKDVAQIRFNLPWRNTLHAGITNEAISSTAKHASTSQQAVGRALRKTKHKSLTISSLDSASTQRTGRDGDESDDNDGSRLDLSLGREKAGGGFQGKSAKLGKLIIHDEGLKMCDLVVAASLGVFWQQYLLTKDD